MSTDTHTEFDPVHATAYELAATRHHFLQESASADAYATELEQKAAQYRERAEQLDAKAEAIRGFMDRLGITVTRSDDPNNPVGEITIERTP